MRLIDADKLYPDSVSIKGNRLCISQSQIANAPTVDVLEQIRQEIDDLDRHYDNDHFSGNDDAMFKCDEVLQIIDKYR